MSVTNPSVLEPAGPVADDGLVASESPQVSVIVPTYREAANLPILVPRICQALAAAGLTGEILIVDDNSPDDTRAVCQALAAAYPVRLHVRYHERGLSSAVLEGMRLATAPVLLVLDADLSHPPEKIPELVAALEDPAVDFVIGSRYVPGAATDEEWGWFRWLNSRVATLLARPFTAAKDPMAGFFALRQSTFRRGAPLDPVGYKIGLELIVKCGCRTIKEIPITFHNRLHGESKLTLKEQVNYLKHLKRLFEYKAGRLAYPLQFAAVGVSGMLVDLLSFVVLQVWLSLAVARALSIFVAMSWNFVWNRRLTFSYARQESLWRQYVLFCASCLAGGVANWAVSVVLCSLSEFFQRHNLVAALLGVATGFGINYVLNRHFVFRLPAHAAPQAQDTRNERLS
jgi:dolichol-phosphate mannosyltransferase